MSDTKVTQYGFTMGPCEVTRICSQAKWGAYIEVSGKRQRVGKIITRKEVKL